MKGKIWVWLVATVLLLAGCLQVSVQNDAAAPKAQPKASDAATTPAPVKEKVAVAPSKVPVKSAPAKDVEAAAPLDLTQAMERESGQAPPQLPSETPEGYG